MIDSLPALVLILTLGIGAQWIAWRVQIPAILLLLLFGMLAGPVTGVLDPDALIGDVLFPAVTLAVGVILFEGGLSLRLGELREIGTVVWRLCSIGALITWVLAGLAAHYTLGLSFEMSALIGAVLVVTGPTVIGPLLRQLRLSDPAASVLRWEGILIDPVGAVLAVLVFEGVLAGSLREATAITLIGLAKAAVIGSGVGLLGAAALAYMLRRYYLPDYLQNPISLTAVGAVLAIANLLQHESGILAVTVMGIALATQTTLPVRSILEFKENLRVLFISSLFIVLAARLDLADLTSIAGPASAFLAILVLVVRPLSVMASTAGSSLLARERIMLMCVAPRGIVAAAVASIFALRLEEHSLPGAESIVPITFFIITGTIVLYAVAAPFAARALGLSQGPPQGVLLIGAQPWSRAIAQVLQKEGLTAVLIDGNYAAVRTANMEGLRAHYGSGLSERIDEELDLPAFGQMLALTPNDEANSLACMHFTEHFGRSGVFQLATDDMPLTRGESAVPMHLQGRILFDKGAGYSEITRRFNAGDRIKSTKLTEEFGIDEYMARYGDTALPMFLLSDGQAKVYATENRPMPKAGDKLVALVPGDSDDDDGAADGDA